MSNDLVEQLEALATGGDAPSGVYMPLAKKAAAKIERLRAENAKLREALTEIVECKMPPLARATRDFIRSRARAALEGK
jgi:hypothetical protein